MTTTNTEQEFDLTTTEGWEALHAAWCVARREQDEVLEALDELDEKLFAAAPAERSALDVRPEYLRVKQREGEASDAVAHLENVALNAPAPNSASLALKLSIFGSPDDWNAFDGETWPVLLEDVRGLLVGADSASDSKEVVVEQDTTIAFYERGARAMDTEFARLCAKALDAARAETKARVAALRAERAAKDAEPPYPERLVYSRFVHRAGAGRQYEEHVRATPSDDGENGAWTRAIKKLIADTACSWPAAEATLNKLFWSWCEAKSELQKNYRIQELSGEVGKAEDLASATARDVREYEPKDFEVLKLSLELQVADLNIEPEEPLARLVAGLDRFVLDAAAA